MKILFVLALLAFGFLVMPSIATSFVFWEFQWWWSTWDGVRLFLLMAVTGGASRR